MKTPIFSAILIAVSLSACFKVPLSATGKLDGSASGTVQAVSTAVGEGKEYASVNADSKESVQLTTPKASGLSGASVVVSPGSLGISVDIVVEQASDFSETSIANEMGLADDIQVSSASAGMIIRPSENVDLKKPLSLAMPLPVGLGFRLTNQSSKYAIFYKYFDPIEQKLVTGFKVKDDVNVKMVFDEKAGKDVLQFEGYFGAYWATILSREVAASEVPLPKPAEEPIINKAKVAVYNATGVVKETEVVAKQALPELVWAKPTIKFVAESRTIATEVAAPAGQKVTACKVDFFEASNLPKGISFEVPLGTSAEYAIVKTAEHSLVSRFRCVDEENRVTISPWSNAVLIPSLVPASSSTDISSEFNTELCADAASPLYAQGYNEYGQLATFETFLPNGKCKYRAKVTVENSGNFYITNQNSTIICGLATHSLSEGLQTISCQKGNISSIGSNHMAIPPGQFYADLDFTGAPLTPKLTLSRLPCDRGEFYLLFANTTTNPSFPPISDANKMKHLGGCEFVYENSTLPLTTSGAMQIRNAAGTYSCGRPTIYWNPNGAMYDHCGSGALSFDEFSAPETALSHKIRLSLGDAAKRRSGNYAQESLVEYNVETNCPQSLYFLSTASGLVPDGEKNAAYRQGACRYEFPVSVDNSNLSVYDFKLANESGAILCGGTSTSGAITLNCEANATAINFQGIVGETVKITVTGNALNGQINSAAISPMNMYCDAGIYLQNEFVNGMKYTRGQAFQEVSECLFEKTWTPTAANPGFYIASGYGSDICGNYSGSTNQPTVDGAAAGFYCNGIQYASQLSPFIPVNSTVGMSYKITVDKRRSQLGRSFVSVTGASAQPSACDEDLYVFSSAIFGSSRTTSTRMTKEGNCNYSFDFDTENLASGQLSYSIHGPTESYTCYGNGLSPLLNGATQARSVRVDCASNSIPFTLDYNGNSHYRLNFNRSTAGGLSRLSLQNLSSNHSPAKIAGNAASVIGVNDREFKHALTGPHRLFSYVWNRSSESNFVLDRNGYGYEYCGLDVNTVANLGSPMGVLCSFGSATAAPVFGNWAAGSYLLEYRPARSVEDVGTLRVSAFEGFSLTPSLAATAADTQLDRAASGSLGVSAATNTPGSLKGAATWTDNAGALWVYGGENGTNQLSSALWRYDLGTNRWVLKSGSLTANQLPETTNPIRPGAKSFAHSWYDSTNNRLYLFGGYGVGLTSGQGEMNDLWYYDPVANLWHLVNGYLNVNAAGSYGALGSANAANLPPSRRDASTWVDAENNFWLFAGSAGGGRFNDIWKFVPSSGVDSAAGLWVWMGGSQENIDSSGDSSYPSARSDAIAWSSAGKAFIFGGALAGVNYNDLWEFSCDSGAINCVWTQQQANVTNAPLSLTRVGVFGQLNRPSFQRGAARWVKAASGDLWLYTNSAFWVYRPSINQWTAFPRLDTNGQIKYGTAYEWGPTWSSAGFHSDNVLGMRNSPLFWSTGTRHFLFGGSGYNSSAQMGVWADLWELQLPSN